MSQPQIRFRIDFGPGCSVGPGKIELLEAIRRSGSLSQAARDLKMSYRRAWLLLDQLNRSFAEPVATTSVGGAHGGGAAVTAFGAALATSYRKIERATSVLARAEIATFARKCCAPAGRKPARRALARRVA
jgi:molybdate transport system regulatory protein